MYRRATMRIHLTVMLTLVTVTPGKSETAVNQSFPVNGESPTALPDEAPHINFVTIKHDLQTEITWTGNDVVLRGITSLDFTLPIAHNQYSTRWSKDNKRIAYDTSRIHFENQGLHLRVNDVRVTDAGTYEFRIIYPAMEHHKPSAVREISLIELIVHDDGDLCSEFEAPCKGYCIPKDQSCTSGNTSLGLIIGAVVGSVIVLFACVLLFLLSRTGRQICNRRSDPGLTETGLREDRALSEYGTPPTSRRNGAVVSFAARPTVQIYEREDEYTSDSGACGYSPADDKTSHIREQNGNVRLKTTNV